MHEREAQAPEKITRNRTARITTVGKTLIKHYSIGKNVLSVSLQYLIKKRGILQVLYILARKENRHCVSLWEIADVRPPEGTFFCSLSQKLQTQFHSPQLLCQMLQVSSLLLTLDTQKPNFIEI